MPAPEKKPSNVYLAPAHLNHICATIDWQGLFDGMGLSRDARKSKPNDWWAYSPFKEEKTASFHMGAGGIWYDFSAGQGGGPIELIQQMHGWNCYEAAHYILAHGWASNIAEVRHTETTVRKKVKAAHSFLQNEPIRQDLLPLCRYHEYLESRGISEDTCKTLGIGYVPQGRSPLRGRVVFQIRDARVNAKTGRRRQVILSHMGRTVDDSTKPKYLFYEGFRKSNELYGQDIIWTDPEAKRQIQDTGYIVLTEGPFDVAKAYEAGLRNVVGSFGAHLSDPQVRALKNMCEHFEIDDVKVVYDRDTAGQKATVKAIKTIEDLSLKASAFDWCMSFTNKDKSPVVLPDKISDLAGFNPKQIVWLRNYVLLCFGEIEKIWYNYPS